MTHLAIEHALLAVMAARGGDAVTAAGHIARAQQQARSTARRERQLVEIAALVVTGDRSRAVGLALEHTVEFPDDAELVARVAPMGTGEVPGSWVDPSSTSSRTSGPDAAR